MNQPAVRSRLLQLKRDLEAARNGRDLLERKRETIVRALGEWVPRRDDRVKVAARELAFARSRLRDTQIQVGRSVIDGAALAQPSYGAIPIHDASIVGVKIPRVDVASTPYRPVYGPAGAAASLDRAGAAFAAVLPRLLILASEETAVKRLRAALARTARRLNTIEQRVLPELTRQIRDVAAALEEEERDEAVRRKCWLTRTGI